MSKETTFAETIQTELANKNDTLNKLESLCDNPWAHQDIYWDYCFALAMELEGELAGTALGARAADISARFRRAGERYNACKRLDLVPAEKAVSFTMDVRVAKSEPIGPGDPLPPPPPPTKACEPWTGPTLWAALQGVYAKYKPWGDLSDMTRETVTDLAAALNARGGDTLALPPLALTIDDLSAAFAGAGISYPPISSPRLAELLKNINATIGAKRIIVAPSDTPSRLPVITGEDLYRVEFPGDRVDYQGLAPVYHRTWDEQADRANKALAAKIQKP